MTTEMQDPQCPDGCEACGRLPYGESVRKEQLAMLTRAVWGQEVFERTITTTVTFETLAEVELNQMAMGAMLYGSAFASIIGMLVNEAPELAHRAIAIHQDMYSNGDVYYVWELYEQAKDAHEKAKAYRAEKFATPASDPSAGVMIRVAGPVNP